MIDDCSAKARACYLAHGNLKDPSTDYALEVYLLAIAHDAATAAYAAHLNAALARKKAKARHAPK